MLEEGTVNEAEKNALDLDLAQKFILGAIITAIGYILLAISGRLDIAAILQKKNSLETSNNTSTAPKLAATSNWLILIGSVILTQVAVARSEEAAANVQASTETRSIIPFMNIAIGFSIATLGNAIKAIGAQQKAEQS